MYLDISQYDINSALILPRTLKLSISLRIVKALRFYYHISAGKVCICVFCRLRMLSHDLTSPDCDLRIQEPQRNHVTTLGYPDDLGSPLMTTLCLGGSQIL